MRAILFNGDERRAGAAFVLVGELEIGDGIIAAQEIMNADSQRAGSLAVNNRNLLETGKLRVVNEFAANLFGFVDGHAANIQTARGGRSFLQKSE